MRPHHIDEVLFTAEQIEGRVDQLIEEIAAACHTENLVIIGILRGSFIFLADLVRHLYKHDIHPRIDFITLESYYSGTKSTGKVHIAKDFTLDVKGAAVILVDDILDTGRTLSFAVEHVRQKGAVNVKTCTLLDKPSRRAVSCEADFVGFKIEDHFVIGYGLDYDSYYRDLPYITKVTFTD